MKMKTHLSPLRAAGPSKSRERGIALVFVLLMIVIAMGVAIVTARMTLMGDKASRNDRDRQVAFQAAELALNDAELDIMDASINNAGDKTKSNMNSVQKARGCQFGNPDSGLGAGEGCAASTVARGFCGLDPTKSGTPLYKYVNWDETDESKRAYVNFGEYTSRSLAVGSGVTPAKKPKYVIFQVPATRKPQVVLGDGTAVLIKDSYRVYAVGYGINSTTQVMLEAEFHKPKIEKTCP